MTDDFLYCIFAGGFALFVVAWIAASSYIDLRRCRRERQRKHDEHMARDAWHRDNNGYPAPPESGSDE